MVELVKQNNCSQGTNPALPRVARADLKTNNVYSAQSFCTLFLLIVLSACDRPSTTSDQVSEAATIDPDVSVVVEPEFLGLELPKGSRASVASVGRIAATDQRLGDPDAGRRALLENDYVSCGLPERVFRQLIAGVPITEVTGRKSEADGLPFSNNLIKDKSGRSLVTQNCLTCHGTVLFDELVIGLGNEFLDFTRSASVFVERAGLLTRGPDEIAVWERYADRIAAIAPYTRTHTIGVNPANNLTLALIAHRDAESNRWSDTALMPLPPSDPPPVSVPPWWRMSKKTAMFNMGEGRGDHARIMMAASMMCTDSLEELKAIDQYAADIRAYISSLNPPAWPFEIDATLSEQGETLFNQTCSQCHGRYGEQADYPSRLVPLETVQTDPLLVEFALSEGLAYGDWYNRSYYGETSTAAPGKGYVAPPLDGIWATAPFLHNGSVPSIRAVLDQSIRPSLWRHRQPGSQNKADYDQRDLGWKFDSVDRRQMGSTKPLEVYDTELRGYTNTGHPFGNHLSDPERSAILEYLKTL